MSGRLALQEGDKIGILSTARWLDKSAVDFADQIFRSWGLVPVYGKTIEARHHQFAGDDELRRNDLQQFLDDAATRAVICARGGYGTIRIIDKIDFTGFMNHPKWICGFSDITVLHTHINDKLGLPTLHCCMPVTFEKNSPEALDTLKQCLFGKMPSYTIGPHVLNKPGKTSGELVGGNLSLLYSLLGTKFGYQTTDKILFLEDIDEYVYHIDRMMMSLKLAGKLRHIKGLVVGGMNDMKDNAVPFGKTAEEIILEYVKEMDIPVCFGFPAGHIDDNRALVFKKKIQLDVSGTAVHLNYI